MDKTLHSQFQRMESLLTTLVESIAAYNPSPQAAIDLLEADDELSRRLDQLARHQANHARILCLRTEAETLEEQLKSSISTLADLRRELAATPATAKSNDSRAVPFDQLLQFATNISRYTVPPTWREAITPPLVDKDMEPTTEASVVAGAVQNGHIVAAEASTLEAARTDKSGDLPRNMTAEEAEWLRKLNDSNQKWDPWPDEEKIRSGNLMRIQYQRDMGTFATDMHLARPPGNEALLTELNGDDPKKLPEMPATSTARSTLVSEASQVSAPPKLPPSVPALFTGYEMFDDD